MNFVGLSPALGAFLAGVVLSGNEYRHELESDIDPFKGLLLGLFFISVGAGMDLSLLAKDYNFIFSMALMIMAVKAMVLFGISKVTKIPKPENWLFILGLSQAGEFAFVLFSLSKGLSLIEFSLLEKLSLVVAVTMFLTPLLFLFYEKVILPRAVSAVEPANYDKIETKGRVVVAGSGRFGQIVSRLLSSYGFKIVTLEHDPQMIELLRRFDNKAYYGDATRPDLLKASGLDEADVFVAATNDRRKQVLMVEHVSKNYPGVKILARARDRHHVYELEAAGADYVVRETFESSLEIGKQALIALGMHPFVAEIKKRKFKNYDLESLSLLKNRWLSQGVDDDYTEMAKARSANLAQLMQNDMASYNQIEDEAEEGWVPPPVT
jgi:CPA2 family monovalent cation:H+ antiporter-2/glutathione-regulated potassium-efflux system ancillary protein KefC